MVAPRLWGLVLAGLILVLDQVSKFWLIAWMEAQGGWQQLTGFFNLVMVWNRGISFGMFQSGETGRWLLVFFSSLVCLGLAVWLWRQDRSWPSLALGAVIGGAVGNIADRIGRGAVADFFDVHIMGYHWPAFNIADSAITIGVVMLLLDSFRAPKDGSGDNDSDKNGVGDD
jgi:signal peptidase II